MASSSDYLIVRLPYYIRELTSPSQESVAADQSLQVQTLSEGEHSQEVVLEFNGRTYHRVIQDALHGRDIEGRPSSAYVYPKRPADDAAIDRHVRELSDYPVVYVVYIDCGAPISRSRAPWLWSALNVGNDFRLDGTRYVVYVGETNNIERRTAEHLARVGLSMGEEDADGTDESDLGHLGPMTRRERQRVDRVVREAESSGVRVMQYVVWQRHFTKSMTLDIEDRMIDYLSSSPGIFLLNGRGNPQGHYYESDKKDAIFSGVWGRLSRDRRDLFPPEEVIRNSELYKVSPFHSLGREQSRAVAEIVDVVKEFLVPDDHELDIDKSLEKEDHKHTKDSRLILVSGASGTGKSIVLSRLFLQLSEEFPAQDRGSEERLVDIWPTNRVCLVVNNEQQRKLYTDLAKKVGLQHKGKDECIYGATTFINSVTSGKRIRPDIVLVDEAHLLAMRPTQGYSRKHHGNQLYDLLLNAKVVIAVFDPEQVMRRRQTVPDSVLDVFLQAEGKTEPGQISNASLVTLKNSETAAKGEDTFRFYRVTLEEQFRMAASDRVIAWIDRLADPESVGIEPIPEDEADRHEGKHGSDTRPYDIRVFSSPNLLFDAIMNRASELAARPGEDGKPVTPLCRVVATYDWDYRPKQHKGRVRLYRVGQTDGSFVWSMPVNGHAPQGALSGPENVFDHPWNMAKKARDGQEVWSADPATQQEVGSYFTIQGFDLNYVGVIIGPSVTYRNGRIVFDGSALKDSDVAGDHADAFARQQFKILLRRGIHGLYLFAVDPELQRALCESARAAGCLDLLT